MNNMLFLIAIFILSFLLTKAILHFSLNKNILAIPNERSLHTVETPHSGGLAIVVIFLVAIGLKETLPDNIVYAIIGSGILVSMVGLWDDLKCIPAKWRFLIHLLAVLWLLYCLNDGSREFRFVGFNFHASLFGLAIIAFLLVWMINLFNFMDGIDGIAASETIFVSCAIAYFSWIQDLNYLTFISLVLASSTLGFLILNWPPAKIFMGDVSSGFLGLTLGIIAYDYILEGGTAWTWVILMGVFITDATLTLFIRIFNKDKLSEAHSNHAYQHAAKKWGHKPVTLTVIVINVLWLFPIAAISVMKPNIAIWMALIALMPLIIAAIKLKVGISDLSEVIID